MKSINVVSKKWLWVFAGVLFITLFAQLTIDIPLNEQKIPISGQTFAVLLVGYLFYKTWGTITLLLYLLIGVLGLPVFADGASGIEVLQGGSGGFLVGFVVGAYAVGWFSENGGKHDFWKCLIAMLIGTLIIMAIGVARLTQLYDFEKALDWGFYPFIPGAVVKIILGAIAAFYLKKKVAIFHILN